MFHTNGIKCVKEWSAEFLRCRASTNMCTVYAGVCDLFVCVCVRVLVAVDTFTVLIINKKDKCIPKWIKRMLTQCMLLTFLRWAVSKTDLEPQMAIEKLNTNNKVKINKFTNFFE